MTENQSLQELREHIRNIIAEVSELDSIPDATPFSELGIDSMMAIEIVAEVEREFGLSIDEDSLASVRDLESVFQLVAGHTAASNRKAA